MNTGFKFFLFLLVNITRVQAQTTPPQLPTVITPSPDVQALQKYGDIPVSSYTGVPDISIPLYTIHYRDISVPITINYHASGIKTTEEASRVGLGWSLNAGGTISRNIVGFDDLASSAFLSGHEDYTSMPLSNAQFCCLAQFTNGTIDTITSQIFSGTGTRFDLQPDQYYFNFSGHSGKFILLRNKQAVLQTQEKIKIVFDQSGQYPIWHITDLEGFVYDFVQFETVAPTNSITAWYLAKITSPVGNQITFNYISLAGSYSSPSYSETLAGVSFEISGSDNEPPPQGNASYVSSENTYNLLALSSIAYGDGLVKFNYSGRIDDGDQKLDSVSVYNLDKEGNPLSTPLQTSAFNYSYFHGDANPLAASWLIYGNDSLRLRLDSVKETGYFGRQSISLNPYIFSYNQSIPLPAKSTSGTDHWGYYNGKSNGLNYIPSIITPTNQGGIPQSTGYLGPERNTDTTYAQAYTLTGIQYPTGGTTQFQYESNDYDQLASEANDASIFRFIADVLPQSNQFSYSNQTGQTNSYVNGAITPVNSDTLDISNAFNNTNITLTAAFVLPSNPQNCINLFTGPQNEPQLAQTGYAYFELYDSSGNLVLHVDPATIPYYSQIIADHDTSISTYSICNGLTLTIHHYPPLTLSPGVYTFRTYISGSGYSSNLTGISATFNWDATITSDPPPRCRNCITFGYAGGLRIKRIVDFDRLNSSNNKVRKYLYHYFADKNGDGILEEYSYGRRMTKPRYYAVAIAYSTNDGFVPTIYGKYSSQSLFQLNGSAAGSVVGYDQVTELQGENGENGETVYKYYNEPDSVHDYFDPTYEAQLPVTPPYGATTPFMENGSLLQKTIYKNAGGTFVKLENDSNAYSIQQESIVYGIDWRLLQSTSGAAYEPPMTPENGPATMYFYPAITSKWFPLMFSAQTIFDQNDTTKSTTITKSYYYDDTSHLLPTRIVVNDSKGEIITTTTHYPLDFPNLTATDPFTLGILNLQNNHIINAPIEKFVQKSNPDGTNLRTTAGLLTAYNPGTPVPDTVYMAEFAAASTSFAPAASLSGSITKDASYVPKISLDHYDLKGNTIQQHKIGDFLYSYLWDYDSVYPIAEVKNADTGSIAYTSFEADGTGNWIIGTGTPDTTEGITGTKSYVLQSGTISRTALNSSNTYIVSYWTKNTTAFNITGTLSGYPIQGKSVTINGKRWTYFEHKVTGQATIGVSGSGNIDELRLYPGTAQMTTYTYAPLIGATTGCDVDNRVTYYDYDGLGRLRDIRDQDGNVIKTFEYHYQGQ